MSISQRIVIVTLKSLTRLICRIDDTQLTRVPQQGPLILYTNHVNILEIPIIYTHLKPRPVQGLVSADRWDQGWSRWLLEVCDSIPLHRGEADIVAIRRSIQSLRSGHIVIISPEGTRSGHGRLQPAHPGVVLLAVHSGAPLLPIVYYGAENYKENLAHLQRTNFHIGVGKPFYLSADGHTITRDIRQQMMTELMGQLAILLPPEYRGDFADMEITSTFLRYL